MQNTSSLRYLGPISILVSPHPQIPCLYCQQHSKQTRRIPVVYIRVYYCVNISLASNSYQRGKDIFGMWSLLLCLPLHVGLVLLQVDPEDKYQESGLIRSGKDLQCYHTKEVPSHRLSFTTPHWP